LAECAGVPLSAPIHTHTLVSSHTSYLQGLQARIEAVGEDPKGHVEGTVRELYEEAREVTRTGR